MIKLSILIPSTHTRRKSFLPSILEQVYGQYESLPKEQQEQVEILTLIDNKTRMLGDKRNNMVNMAQGEYIVHVDDDDRISTDYISSLLEAIESGKDVIVFQASVSLNGEEPKLCYYSHSYSKDYNSTNKYFRIPNHICCVKRELALQVPFKNIQYGEDSAYSKELLHLLKSEHVIDKVLYYYDYNQDTTETQQHLKPVYDLDLVILSNAKTPQLKAMTEKAILTAVSGARGYKLNIIVIEQQEVMYRHARTVHLTKPFNYNEFSNIGSRMGNAERIMIANNDLTFSLNWLHHLIKANHPLVSPKCPIDPRQRDVRQNEEGEQCGRHLSGWCFMITRDLWERIGGFDEDFSFYCADNSLIEQCIKVGLKPMLVPLSQVRHLGSSTLKTAYNYNELTFANVHKFNVKYNKNLFEGNKQFEKWKKSQSV